MNKKMDIFNDIKNMYETTFKQKPKNKLTSQDIKFRVKAMKEEINEFREAANKPFNNKTEMLDAIIDLIVFATGTAWQMGITNYQFNQSWEAVMEANNKKILCQSKEESKRSYKFDLKKPVDWVDPKITIKKILEEKK